MKIIYANDYESMSRKAANIISAQIILYPKSVLGLATGSTPLGVYKQLIEWYKKGDLDFSNISTINLDEYYGLSKDNKNSYAYFMNKNFFDHININKSRVNIPDGLNNDTKGECKRYNEIISNLGGIDLQLLGIGHNGHIGFNEPQSTFERDTHFVALSQNTIKANSRFFDKPEDVPKYAFTMGIKNIMNAKKILLLSSGESKAEILYRVVTGNIEPHIPGSILQLHNDVTIIADRSALSKIIEECPHLITSLD